MDIDLSQFAEKEEPDFIVALGLDEYARKTLTICPCREGLDSAMDCLAEEAQKNGLLLRRDRHLVLKDKDGLTPHLVAELERNSYAVRTMKLKELGKQLRREMIQELNERLSAERTEREVADA
jgi:hypothetical protein